MRAMEYPLCKHDYGLSSFLRFDGPPSTSTMDRNRRSDHCPVCNKAEELRARVVASLRYGQKLILYVTALMTSFGDEGCSVFNRILCATFSFQSVR